MDKINVKFGSYNIVFLVKIEEVIFLYLSVYQCGKMYDHCSIYVG